MAHIQHLSKVNKESISTFNQCNAAFTNLIQGTSPPQAIYVPTVAVHNNLTPLIQNVALSVWENAPASAHSLTGTPPSGYGPPALSTMLSAAKTPFLPNIITQPSQPMQKSAQDLSRKKETPSSHQPHPRA
jgi:hypothetical protein